jgi:hypothetical protein
MRDGFCLWTDGKRLTRRFHWSARGIRIALKRIERCSCDARLFFDPDRIHYSFSAPLSLSFVLKFSHCYRPVSFFFLPSSSPRKHLSRLGTLCQGASYLMAPKYVIPLIVKLVKSLTAASSPKYIFRQLLSTHVSMNRSPISSKAAKDDER